MKSLWTKAQELSDLSTQNLQLGSSAWQFLFIRNEIQTLLDNNERAHTQITKAEVVAREG